MESPLTRFFKNDGKEFTAAMMMLRSVLRYSRYHR
jgi:hypothetical protein